MVASDMAANALALGHHQRVLIVSSEVASGGLDTSAPAMAGLFGDGAAVVIVGRSAIDEGSAFLSSRLSGDGNGADLCRIRGGGTRYPRGEESAPDALRTFSMDGRGAYRFAARYLPAFWEQLLREAGNTTAALHCLVPHQASGGGLDHVVQTLRLRFAQVIRILHATGNQVAASLPHALHHVRIEQRWQRGDLFALVGTVQATANGIEFCKRNGCPRLLYMSSSSVFYRQEHQYDLTEDTQIGPGFVNTYAQTKTSAKPCSRRIQARNPCCAHVRCSGREIRCCSRA